MSVPFSNRLGRWFHSVILGTLWLLPTRVHSWDSFVSVGLLLESWTSLVQEHNNKQTSGEGPVEPLPGLHDGTNTIFQLLVDAYMKDLGSGAGDDGENDDAQVCCIDYLSTENYQTESNCHGCIHRERKTTWLTVSLLVIWPTKPKNGWSKTFIPNWQNFSITNLYNVYIWFSGIAFKQFPHGAINKRILEKVES